MKKRVANIEEPAVRVREAWTVLPAPSLVLGDCAEESKAEQQRVRFAIDAALSAQLSRRLPLGYAIIIVNLMLVANAFYGTATNLYLGATTIPLLLIAGARALHWQPAAVARRSPEKISRDLRLLPFSGTAVAVVVTVFGLCLYPLGNSQQQSLIHYIATLTSFIGILGLNPSRRTALGMTLVSVVPSTAMFLYFDHENAVSISVIMVSVSFLLLVIAQRQHDGLTELIKSRIALEGREIEAADLSERLHQKAYMDELTAIPNRRAFFQQFDLQLSDSNTLRPWLVLIDLDEFKAVNDLFGHQAGDAILKAVASRIAKFDGVQFCGRLGGDEFGIFLPGTLAEEEATTLVGELAEQISQPVLHESQSLTVKPSIGIRKTEGLSINECVERADWALYKAKQGASRIVIFAVEDEIILEERKRITQLFGAADLSGELDVAYQPIVNFDSGEIQSVEVLARWHSKDGSLIMPDVFIPIAENTQRSSEVTKVIFEKSIRQLPTAFRDTSLHVNLSAKDITNDQFIDWLASSEIFEIVPRSQIIVELTETAILSGGAKAAENLEFLRVQGFRVALDDFGVGQSSLSRIHQLPLDQIKIDRSFCGEPDASENGWAIVATILALSRQLGLECVLEGIETEGQALRARALGVRLMQGFYFSKPQSAEYFMSGGNHHKVARAVGHI